MAQVDSENSTATPADPIYAAIEAHRAAYAAYARRQKLPTTKMRKRSASSIERLSS